MDTQTAPLARKPRARSPWLTGAAAGRILGRHVWDVRRLAELGKVRVNRIDGLPDRFYEPDLRRLVPAASD